MQKVEVWKRTDIYKKTFFFLKLFCFILKDSAFALSQFEPDESARGQSHLGAGG